MKIKQTQFKKTTKKSLAILLAATTFMGTGNFTLQIFNNSVSAWPWSKKDSSDYSGLKPDQLAADYSSKEGQLEFAKFSPEQQDAINRFKAKVNENQFYQELINGKVDELQVGRGATVAGNKTTEALAGSAKWWLPIIGTFLVLKFSGDILGAISNLLLSAKVFTKRVVHKLTHKGIDIKNYKKVVGRIESRLRKELVGQDDAIDSIIRVLTGYYESMIEAKYLGKKFEGGLILYLIGLPATGKSTVLKIISEEMKLGSFTCRMSDVIEDKGNSAQTIATRLTKPIIKDNGKKKVTEETELSRYLNSGIPTLYLFDEIDKMRILDSKLSNTELVNKDEKINGSSIDEAFRNFIDTGHLFGCNASGSIVMVTSNESVEDIQKLESSLYNRYKTGLVTFKEFNEDDYKEIIKRASSDIIARYKRQYDVDVVWGDSALDYYAKQFINEQAGGRGPVNLARIARAALEKYVSENKLKENVVLTLEMGSNDKLVACVSIKS